MNDTVSEDVKLTERWAEIRARMEAVPEDTPHIEVFADAVEWAADLFAYLATTKPASPLAGEVEVTGEMWLAGRKAFDTEAEKFRAADRYEMASAIADRAPEIIFNAMLAASRPKEDTQQ